ncbi:Nuclear pore complex protein [Sarcoptes scabiei]|uniref:Nuclear pore complex protein n=1 Tax=Sarcoptes scabiei TaxID=52283 RepID=A0A834VIY9_SARSC|nr:Nuclear pore complex protein [Sarcoptes scabiei]
MFANPNSIGSSSIFSSASFSNNSPCYSIFYNVSFEDSDTNYVQLKNSFSQNSTLGTPTTLLYTASCSLIDKNHNAHFFLATNTGSLNVIQLPPPLDENQMPETKFQVIDLKKNNFIGKLFNGIVPSIIAKSSSGLESAVHLLSYEIHDDVLIFALCRDGYVRILSLKQQDFLIIQSVSNQQSIIPAKEEMPKRSEFKAVSMKFWWHENESSFPNLIIYVTGNQYNQFFFYQVVLPNINSPVKNSVNFGAQQIQEKHLRYLFQRSIPNQYEVIDYFVHNSQLWAMWQHNETINLQYYSIDTNYETEQPFEWIPVMSDIKAYPEIGLRSPLVNPREYFINEIFWRGNFSLKTISKAIVVFNQSVGNEKQSLVYKIDSLVQEAVKLVDNIIRSQAENQLEMSVEEYIQCEVDAWNKLFQFCLDYHVDENEPLSIFVDSKTGVKGIIRKICLDFIPSLSPFDELIQHYFLHCKQNHLISQNESKQNGGLTSKRIDFSNNFDQFSVFALEFRLNMLMRSIQTNQSSAMFSVVENLKNSILVLLHGMSAINATLKDEDLLDFEAFMLRMSSFSTKTKLSLADIAKKITEDSLLPELPSLSDSNFITLIDDFFEKCPLIIEAIKFFILHINYDFLSESEINDYLGISNEMEILMANEESTKLKMNDALEYEIKPIFSNLLSSRCSLNFIVTSISKVIQMRYKFCRDLFLLQYMLTSFHSKVKSDCKSKIIQDVQSFMIPSTSQLLFALNHLNWTCDSPMITPNVWHHHSSNVKDLSVSNLNISFNKSNAFEKLDKTVGSSFDYEELLSVLEMRDYINLNRVGILSHESFFYDAYPRANILYFFVQFSGGVLAKRLLSYTLSWKYANESAPNRHDIISDDGIWSNLIPSYMNSICQLLWPFSPGQFKLAEFLLGVGQYHLVERFVDKLHPWCTTYSYSRYFMRGICYLMTGESQKAINQFKQSVFGINMEPFFKIFVQKPKISDTLIERINDDDGLDSSNKSDNNHLRKNRHKELAIKSEIDLNARTLFRYYNKLIQLFNRYSTPDYVIELANCVLMSLKKESDPEYKQHHSAIHSILFTCHLRLGNYVQAYEAMISNEDEDQKHNCLRQFIVNLCESRKFKELVSYPYIGLEDDFVKILQSKAHSSAIKQLVVADNNSMNLDAQIKKQKEHLEVNSTSPNYYHILYSYFLNTMNYRQAAQAIYDYYRQLSQEYVGNETMLRLQSESLLMARNCLKCLDDSKYSWIVKKSIKKTDQNTKKNHLKRKHGYFANESDTSIQDYDQENTIIEIVNVDELIREYELIKARLRLLERNSKEFAIAATPLSAEETIILCISASLYEQSFKIAELFDLSFEPIFDGMTSKFIQLLNTVFTRRRIDDETMINILTENSLLDGDALFSEEPDKNKLGNEETNSTVELFDIFYKNTATKSDCSFVCYSSSSICDRMWHLILYYLRCYEKNPKVSTRYCKTVAVKILSNGIMLPISLIKIYQKFNCNELIRLLMLYNFLPEATQITIDYMNAFMGEGMQFFDLTHNLIVKCKPLCIPLHLFDCLELFLQEEYELQKHEESTLNPNNSKWLQSSGEENESEFTAIDEEIKYDRIDYGMYLNKLKKIRLKLDKTIKSCSKI